MLRRRQPRITLSWSTRRATLRSGATVSIASSRPRWTSSRGRRRDRSCDRPATVDATSYKCQGQHHSETEGVATYDLYLRARGRRSSARFRALTAADLKQGAGAVRARSIERDAGVRACMRRPGRGVRSMSLVTGLVDRDDALGVMRPAAERALELDRHLLAEKAPPAIGVVRALEFQSGGSGGVVPACSRARRSLTGTSPSTQCPRSYPWQGPTRPIYCCSARTSRIRSRSTCEWSRVGMVGSSAVAAGARSTHSSPSTPPYRCRSSGFCYARWYTFAGHLPEAFAVFDELEQLGHDIRTTRRARLMCCGRRYEGSKRWPPSCQDPSSRWVHAGPRWEMPKPRR